MITCGQCGTQCPDGSAHCVQCGASLQPAKRAPGNTSHFGEDELKGLISRVSRDEQPEPPEQNLLAGMPRHRVGSMVSPLLGGRTTPTAKAPEKRARSASGSTVMGMPLFTAGQAPVPKPAAPSRTPSVPPQQSPLAPAPIGGGPSIQSLGAFQEDLDTTDPTGSGDHLSAPPPGAPEAAAPMAARSAPVEPAAPEPPAEPSIDDAPELPPPGSIEEEALPPPPSQRPRATTGPMPIVHTGSSPSNAGAIIAVVVLAAVVAGVAFYLLQ